MEPESLLARIDPSLARIRRLGHFQPIVCLSRDRVIGLEALSRFRGDDGGLLAPYPILEKARRVGLTIELDRVNVAMALNDFSGMRDRPADLTLFLNVEGLNLLAPDSPQLLLTMLREAGIYPRNVVLEILESDAGQLEPLRQATDRFRSHGLAIAIDDVGEGYSNMNRIASLKPDIIKLDRELVRDIDAERHKRSIVRALLSLARDIGAILVAEGVERDRELDCLLDLRVDYFQGFLFATPQVLSGFADLRIDLGMKSAMARMAKRRNQCHESRRQLLLAYQDVMDGLCAGLEALGDGGDNERHEGQESLLAAWADASPLVDCLFIIDWEGRLSTATVFSQNSDLCCRPLFRPAGKGEDLSLHDYYLVIRNGAAQYLSDPYISKASGQLCRTMARVFRPGGGTGPASIACVDFLSQEEGLASG